jgi:two-component system cell cycle response regulator
MTARILVVDDVPANVRLLEARLLAEYFEVLAATNGEAALRMCQSGKCDLVLLDVMMPGMDGFEVARRLRRDPATTHLPIIMVTALDQPDDRVAGLEAGADDFLSKPVNDLALVTRVKSLLRVKMLTDELRMRAATSAGLGASAGDEAAATLAKKPRGRLLVIDDRASSYERIVKILSAEHSVMVVTNPQEALFKATESEFDAAIVSSDLQGYDYLRLCSQFRSLERTRALPIVVVVSSEQDPSLIRALDLGISDYVRRPIDKNEMLARLRTQVRHKFYQAGLRERLMSTLELAVTDSLTGLHNRRYFDMHLQRLFEAATQSGKPMALVVCDIDHFKHVNDRHGHMAGDEVLREFSARVRRNIRSADLACRYGGEEFVVIMPETDPALATTVAERIREEVESHPFIVQEGKEQLPITVSIGVACRDGTDDTPEKLFKRADFALYSAKRAGRNRVFTEAA